MTESIRCTRCHRPLKDPLSISLGIGPECRNGSHKSRGRSARSIPVNIPPEKEEQNMENNALAKLDRATHMLAEAKSLEEVKHILDLAEAARVYARAAKLGLEAANHAAEIKLRAERKAGDLLKQLERDTSFHGNQSVKFQGEKSPSQYREVLLDQAIPTTTAHRWQQVASVPDLKFETYLAEVKDNGGELTTSGLLKKFNYKRDTKSAAPQDIYTPQGMDACQTPAYALDPLLPYLKQFKRIWEPACGEGLLVDALQDWTGARFEVIATDILQGQNFFDFEPEHEWECIVTNPPYSIKFQWLARCYTLGKPFALLMPVETLGTKTAQDLFERYGIEVILLDKRVNFKMPRKGWDSGGAQFPTAWFTWQLHLPAQLTYGKINYE